MTAFDITKLPRNMREKILPCETHSFGGSQCWEWVGATNSRGYGSVTAGVKGKTLLAHRRAYMEVVGEIPHGLTIDHLCFNKVCVNTDHLEAVSVGENIRRAIARQTHCKQGHPLSGKNLRIQKRKNGWVYRICRECATAQSRAANARVTERRRASLPKEKWRMQA